MALVGGCYCILGGCQRVAGVFWVIVSELVVHYEKACSE